MNVAVASAHRTERGAEVGANRIQNWFPEGEPARAIANQRREDVAWAQREMAGPEGGWYAALDADSEGEEGRYYVWDAAEVRALLAPAQWALVAPHYGFDLAPNFEGHAWNPVRARPLAAVAAAQGVPVGL